jgi:hypothetical protein
VANKQIFRSWLDAAVSVAQRRGPIEIFALVDAAVALKPVQTPRNQLALRMYRLANRGENGWSIAERPNYRLQSPKRPDALHRFTIQNLAYKVLSVRRGQFSSAVDLI